MVSKKVLVLLLLILTSIAKEISGKLERSHAADKPHIIFMMVDDWGWANVGYHRNPPTSEVVTPNIDSLVKDGLELDQHYMPTSSAHHQDLHFYLEDYQSMLMI